MSLQRLRRASCALFVIICPGASALAEPVEATEEAVRLAAGSQGIVLLDVYWNRVWRCGRFENAQLRRLVFERLPLASPAEAPMEPLVLENPSRLAPPPRFVPYALLVTPGDYDLTSFEVGFARSLRDVGSNVVARASAIVDGRSRLGSFSVAADEVVYIGNFAVDCYGDPIPWRYFTEGRPNFSEHLAQYKAKYPVLDTERVTYRLFQTKALGGPYRLE